MEWEKYNLDLINELQTIAMEAFKANHYFQSAVIFFQRLEIILRFVTFYFAKKAEVNETAISEINREQSFFHLITFFSLIIPKNEISKSLIELNKRRNSFTHRLFIDFESAESVKDELKDFSREAIKLNLKLNKLLEKTLEKIA